MVTKIVKISEVVDRQALGSFQYFVLLLCAATLAIEGYDTQAIAFVAPALGKAWGMSRGALGPVFAAGLFGLMLGSLLIAPLADYFGRRRIIVVSALVFGVMTLVTPLSDSLSSLLLMRFLTGIGLGGAMANCVSLAAEYTPTQKRASIVMMVFTGFPIGAAIGGTLAARLIPLYGWESVFVVGGVLTLAVWLTLALKLPESVQFLALRPGQESKLARLLAKIDRTFDPSEPTRYATNENPASGITVRHLFRDGRAGVTPLLWIVYFMSLLDLYLLASWLPTTLHERGISIELAVLATALFQVGGIVGAIGLGMLTRRFGAYRIVPVAYLFAAICIASIAFVGVSVPLTMLSVFFAGFTVIGCQNCNNGLASILYPTAIRSTGVGWANGIGRAGSIAGPTIAGTMLTMNAEVANIFLAGAVPALCAAAAVSLISRQRVGAAYKNAPQMTTSE